MRGRCSVTRGRCSVTRGRCIVTRGRCIVTPRPVHRGARPVHRDAKRGVAPRPASGERDSGSCALHERGSSISDTLCEKTSCRTGEGTCAHDELAFRGRKDGVFPAGNLSPVARPLTPLGTWSPKSILRDSGPLRTWRAQVPSIPLPLKGRGATNQEREDETGERRGSERRGPDLRSSQKGKALTPGHPRGRGCPSPRERGEGFRQLHAARTGLVNLGQPLVRRPAAGRVRGRAPTTRRRGQARWPSLP
jgi:hypothetical protein